MRFRQILITATLLAATALPSWAATYYVAPTGATLSSKPDGTRSRPWASVDDAMTRAKGGDTILLMDGEHEQLRFKNVIFALPVTIQSENGLGARIEGAYFYEGSKNIRLRNLTVWRAEGSGARDLISSSVDSSAISIEGLDIGSRKNALDYLNWKQARWLDVAGTGVKLLGSQNVVRNNIIRGVDFGIIVGRGALVEDNIVDGFSKDGMRGSNETTFRNNIVKNCIHVDKTHNDGIQSYAGKSDVTGLRIEGNTIIEWDRKTLSPLRCAMQGIGLFDGYYDNLTIINNLIAVRASNGIGVLGARKAVITNNTVVNISGEPGKAPAIRLADRKKSRGGGASRDVVVANNIAMIFMGKSDAANNIKFEDNAVILDPAKALSNVAAFDYRPKLGSGFVDSGNVKYAPKLDILNHARPFAKGPDKGAYEVGSN